MVYQIGNAVISPKGEGRITTIKSGWIAVSIDGTDAKYRASKLTPVPATTPEPAAEPEAKPERLPISQHIKQYREQYTKSMSTGGNKSLHNGDDLAVLLAGSTPGEVCALADRLLPLPDGTHLDRYCHLNAGQQRMNAGNKLRAALKKGKISGSDLGLGE